MNANVNRVVVPIHAGATTNDLAAVDEPTPEPVEPVPVAKPKPAKPRKPVDEVAQTAKRVEDIKQKLWIEFLERIHNPDGYGNRLNIDKVFTIRERQLIRQNCPMPTVTVSMSAECSVVERKRIARYIRESCSELNDKSKKQLLKSMGEPWKETNR